MTTPDIAGLCERLRAVESSGHSGVTTNWHRNPDGPEAADTLERQAAEIERLRGALERIASTLLLNDGRAGRRLGQAVTEARAALTGEDTATLSLSGKTQTDTCTRGDA
jgi:hypothetical protein